MNPASFGDFNTTPTIGTAKLIDALLLKVTGSAMAEIAQPTPVSLTLSKFRLTSDFSVLHN
ncbi:hypothetical protein [Devosia sp.]|uniref:hypothetical protein n=1 Tax=Devosia sp. TaxID=1871048 RepID=UPI00326333C2